MANRFAIPSSGATVSPLLRSADWLELVATLPTGSVDLLYVDPPFNTGKAKSGRAGRYADTWPSLDAYLDWLRERLQPTIPAIKPTGSILLHVDWRTSHRVRVLLDDLLDEDRFVN